MPVRRILWRRCKRVLVGSQRLFRRLWPLTRERVPKRIPKTPSEHRGLALLSPRAVDRRAGHRDHGGHGDEEGIEEGLGAYVDGPATANLRLRHCYTVARAA